MKDTDSYRSVKDSYWTDALILDLTPEEKLFYIWLFTNQYVQLCGCYQVSIKSIEYETGLGRDVVLQLIKNFIDLGRIRYDNTTKEILLLKWKKNNIGFFNPKNKNTNKAIHIGAAKIQNTDFRRIVYEWIGITEAPYPNNTQKEEAPTLAPTQGATLAPCYNNNNNNNRNKNIEPTSSPPLDVSQTETHVPAQETAVTTKISIFEFRMLYEHATNELMPPGLNNRASELCRLYSKQALEAAFESAAASGGKTLRYVEEILKGKPKGVSSEKQRARASPATYAEKWRDAAAVELGAFVSGGVNDEDNWNDRGTKEVCIEHGSAL